MQRALRPSDFSYKHEAKHGCVLLTAPFWSLDDRTIWRLTQETLSNIHCGNYSSYSFMEPRSSPCAQRAERCHCTGCVPPSCICVTWATLSRCALVCWRFWINLQRMTPMRSVFPVRLGIPEKSYRCIYGTALLPIFSVGMACFVFELIYVWRIFVGYAGVIVLLILNDITNLLGP